MRPHSVTCAPTVGGCAGVVGPEFFLAASRKHTEAGKAVEILPKGVAVKLSEGVRYVDHTGIERDHIRARWWELPDPEIGYDWLAFPHNPDIPALPVKAESFEQIPGYALDAPPLFFGHYLKPGESRCPQSATTSPASIMRQRRTARSSLTAGKRKLSSTLSITSHPLKADGGVAR